MFAHLSKHSSSEVEKVCTGSAILAAPAAIFPAFLATGFGSLTPPAGASNAGMPLPIAEVEEGEDPESDESIPTEVVDEVSPMTGKPTKSFISDKIRSGECECEDRAISEIFSSSYSRLGKNEDESFPTPGRDDASFSKSDEASDISLTK